MPILFALVILTQSFISIKCNDNEFAEFDDFAPSETFTNTEDLTAKPQPSVSQGSVDSKTIPDKVKEASETKGHIKTESKPGDETVEEQEDKSGPQAKKLDLKLVDAPLPRIYKWESYYIEIAFIFALCLYFINLFLGSNKNKMFAQEWYVQSRDLLKQQFALVGGAPIFNDGPTKRNEEVDNIPNLKKQRGLIKVTDSVFTLWNSGRAGMDGMLIEINLLKRQDLFSMALNLLKNARDTLNLRVLLSSDGYENFVFCLAHKSYAAKLARDMVDINTFCPKRKSLTQLGIDVDRLFVMSELGDVNSFIFDAKTVNFLKQHGKSINYIHITDQYSTIKGEELSPAQRLASPKRMATFSFALVRNSIDNAEIIIFALNLLDRLRRFKLARDSKQRSDKNRQKITDILQKTEFSQRQEAAQAKKEELRRLEKERIYNEDDPEKQRRWERKEAKREQKKNKMRVKQLKVKAM